MLIEMESLRKIGYDILINHFEPFLRGFLINDVLLKNYKNDWRNYINVKIIKRIKNQRDIDINKLAIEPFFEELLLSDLKRLIILSISLGLPRYLQLSNILNKV